MQRNSGIGGWERRRSGDRSVVHCPVKIKPRDRSFFESAMRDLSTTGFQVKCPAELDVGTAIFVMIPGLEMLPAHVQWKSGFTYGCKFDRSLYPAVLEHIVKQAR
ncbi:PilZ domain-containing protein [Parasphingorhabdus sp.]|uniref:PilZ domain-containing protein n=1 Tax=Parasphingorhabdus sp. TaxID=2709688 RepID=UPI0030024ADF